MPPTATRKPFSDPFDDLSDEAFEREVLEALDQATTKISLRVPNELLGRTKHVAENRGVPYQSLMKALIDQGVRRLERVPARSKRAKPNSLRK
jgi:predicted DNA binding CopG/RHH family protein